jgi:adenine phosphoribosyltransferase
MVSNPSEILRSQIRNIPDFPKKGIVFRDITTVLQNRDAYRIVNDLLYDRYRSEKVDKVISVEARGFIFGSVLASRLGAGFVPVRKPGKLPSETLREEYELEYGTDSLEIHTDAVARGERILIVDDLLATGGTVLAASRLVERLGGEIVGVAFLIELSFLNGRRKLGKYDVFSIVTYDSE